MAKRSLKVVEKSQADFASSDTPLRRIGVFLMFDAEGVVSEYIGVSLLAFRPFFERLIVVVNGSINAEGQSILEDLCDDLWFRENTDFDVGGYKYAIERLGAETLKTYDELILLNYTFYAPINPIEPMFQRMEQGGFDFWGVTDYRDDNHHFAQSYFLAIRSTILNSSEFYEYWDDMPRITSVEDSILHHEKGFTYRFSKLGFKWDVAYPTKEGERGNVTIASPIDQMRDGCPIVKYRAFCFPVDNLQQREAPQPGRTLTYIAENTDYDADLIIAHVARVITPLKMSTNLGLTRIICGSPARSIRSASSSRGTLGVFLNIPDEATLELLQSRLGHIRSSFDAKIFVTAGSAFIVDAISSLFDESEVNSQILEKPISNTLSLLQWSHALVDSEFDLILSLGGFAHTRKINSWLSNRAEHYYDNLVGSEAVVDEISSLLLPGSRVGMVMSTPAYFAERLQQSYWGPNRRECRSLAAQLGIPRHLIEEMTPLYPPHGLFWMRGDVALSLAREFMDLQPAVLDKLGADLGGVYDRIMTARLAKDGMIAYRVVTAANAAVASSAVEWSTHQALIDVAVNRKKVADLEAALKAAPAPLAAPAAVSGGVVQSDDYKAVMSENQDLRVRCFAALAELERLRQLVSAS